MSFVALAGSCEEAHERHSERISQPGRWDLAAPGGRLRMVIPWASLLQHSRPLPLPCRTGRRLVRTPTYSVSNNNWLGVSLAAVVTGAFAVDGGIRVMGGGEISVASC